MNKKLTLDTVVNRLKKQLERCITENRIDLVDNYDTYDQDYLNKLEEQLMIIKDVSNDANKKKHSDGKTNQYYIYRLSNLHAKRVSLEKVSTDDVIDVNLDAQQQLVADEISDIKQKLDDFNKSKTVKVNLDPDLKDLFIEWGLEL